MYCAWAGFSGGKAQENDCHSLCFCSMSQWQWWGQWLITSASTECTLSSNIAMYIYQHAIVPTNNRFYNKPCFGCSFLTSTLVFSQHKNIIAYSTCALCWPLRATESDSIYTLSKDRCWPWKFIAATSALCSILCTHLATHMHQVTHNCIITWWIATMFCVFMNWYQYGWNYKIYFYKKLVSQKNQTLYENFTLQKFGAIWYTNSYLKSHLLM